MEKEDENRAGRGVAPAVPAASESDGGDGGDGNEDRRTSFILTWRISERPAVAEPSVLSSVCNRWRGYAYRVVRSNVSTIDERDVLSENGRAVTWNRIST